MGSELLWGWDTANNQWRKVQVDNTGKLLISDADPFEIVQDTPEDLKHVPHGRVAGDGVYLPFAVDADGKLQIDIAALEHLNDIADLNVPAPTDGYVLTWDDATSKWIAAVATGGSQVIWKDASERALTDSNRTTTLNFTDLDLTAYTSAAAKFAIIQLRIHSDAVGASGYSYLTIRKNGTTPAYAPLIMLEYGMGAGNTYFLLGIVGLDAGQGIEYKIYVDADFQIDSYIDILGYIE